MINRLYKDFSKLAEPFLDISGYRSASLFLSELEGHKLHDSRYEDEDLYDRVIEYFNKTVIPHKIAVWESGMGLIEKALAPYAPVDNFEGEFKYNLWIHDLSKFSIDEAPAYALHDFQSKEEDIDFVMAWHHHKQFNPHHPEYWLDVDRSGEVTARDMPMLYVYEMVADWMGAGKTYGSSLEEWLPENLPKFKFSLDTRYKLANLLKSLNIETAFVDRKLEVI